MSQEQDKYIPGQCNIGHYEEQRRLKTGIFGIILVCGFSFLFQVFGFPKFVVFLVLFISAASGALGILQYKSHFCVGFGLASVFNFETFRNLSKVKNLSDIEKDKNKALRLIMYAMGIGLVYASLYVLFV